MVWVVGAYSPTTECAIRDLLPLTLRRTLAREVGLHPVTFRNRMADGLADELARLGERNLAVLFARHDVAGFATRLDVETEERGAFGDLHDELVAVAVDVAEAQLRLGTRILVRVPVAGIDHVSDPGFTENFGASGSGSGTFTVENPVDDCDIRHGITLLEMYTRTD